MKSSIPALPLILCLLASFLCPALTPKDALSKVYIDLEAPAVKKLPLAVQEFKHIGAGAQDETVRYVKKEILDALKSDLKFSNLFTIIDKEAYIEDASKSGLTADATNFGGWRSIGADMLIKGGFAIDKERLTVEVRLFDCINEKEVLGKRYVGSLNNPRRLAHYFTDQIYEELTGRKGVFTTKLLFVSNKTGNKEVYISDYDGKNARQLTRNRSINLSPQWSPDGKKIIYTSYKKGWPCLYMLDMVTGTDVAVSDRPGINIGGRFSPDGKTIALTMSTDKSPEIFLLYLNSRVYKRLTDNYGIDVSPSWSPDGRRIAYVSDTSGNPHIFMLDSDSGATRRLTFGGRYNSSPVWSPDGKLIAFARSDNGNFNIWVKDPGGDGGIQLTFDGDNRSPSWSPDGRYIVFSRTVRGASSLYIMLSDGTGVVKLDTGVGSETSPVWSPYLP